jgi:signal peptidase I
VVTDIERVVALPGETWTERAGYVYIDDKRLVEPYVKRDRGDSTSPKRTIPAGQYFLMGDNRTQSCDSRAWGAVSRENIIGRVIETRRGG